MKPFKVEIWKGHVFVRQRTFRTKAAAFAFVAHFRDEHPLPWLTLVFGPGLPSGGSTWDGVSAFSDTPRI